ncbi:MAG: cytochrome P450 [Lentilitoribacter sp.]
MNMSKKENLIVEGIQSWPWYLGFLKDSYSCLNKMSEQPANPFVLGNPVPFGGRGRRHVFAFSEEANKTVLAQPDIFRSGGQVIKGPKNSAHQRLRTGIIAMNGRKHRQHRKLMQPPFAKIAVATYVPTITRLIDQVLDRWDMDKPFDMYVETTKMANWIAAHILFDHDDFDRSTQTCELITKWIDLDVKARKLPVAFDITGTAGARLLRHAEVVEEAMHELINAKRKETEPGKDVLSILVHAAKVEDVRLTDVDLSAHAVILHAAAFVTTATALAWAMYLIAQNPKFAADLNDEIEANITNWPPDAAQVDSLPLLDGLIRESLRLLPPVHHVIRTATKDAELEGVEMRSGDRAVVSAFMTHRDPDIFSDPTKFDPTRWMGTKPGPFQFIPFSAGPRLCLGYQFVMLEMKLVVIRAMQRFKLNLVEGSHIDANVQLTLRPAEGLPMVVSKPDGQFSATQVTGNINELVKNEQD